MSMKFSNNAATTLAQGVAPADGTVTINPAVGVNFPALGAGDYFYLTLQGNSGTEVVKVTAVNGYVFTVTRAQDGTAAQSFNIGDRAELRLVAAALNDIPKLDENNVFAGTMTLQKGATFNDGTVLSSMMQLGSRNRLHNGNFQVNQRGIASPQAAGAGVYGFDRWKAGTGGCTFSFVVNGKDVTLTITAGSLLQIIAASNVEGGVYALANRGTAQARIAVNGAATSGAYAAATVANPLLSANANGGQTMSVEFSLGTVSLVQLEPGTVATPFERLDYGNVLYLCQQYYERSFDGNPQSISGAHHTVIATGGLLSCGSERFTVKKLTAPNITYISPIDGATGQAGEYNASTVAVTNRAMTLVGSTTEGYLSVANAATAGNQLMWHWIASCEP